MFLLITESRNMSSIRKSDANSAKDIDKGLSKTYRFLCRYPVVDLDGNPVTYKTRDNKRQPREDEVVMTSVYPGKGTYYVPKRKLMEMCRCVHSDIINRREFYVTESIPKDNNPFRLDIDMKSIFSAKNSEYKKRRKKDVKRIIIRVYDYFCNFMLKKFNVNHKNLTCYAMAKRDMREDTTGEGIKYIDGIHLLFPYIRQSSTCLRKITDMVKFIASEDDDVFQGSLSSQSCIDNIETKNWTVYGSVKEGLAYVSTHTLYRDKSNVTRILGANISESPETIRRFMMTQNTEIEPVEPRSEFKVLLDEEKRDAEERRKERLARMSSVEFSEEELSKASDLLHMLNPSRFEGYDNRRNIGFMIHNISNGHEEGFELWKQMLEKMAPHEYFEAGRQQKMIDLWDYATRKALSGDGTGLSMGSLVYWAKEDNPDQYDNWRRNIYHSEIDMAITKLSEGRICTLAKSLYGREFVYTKESNWFKFDNRTGHWVKDKFKQPKFMFNMFNIRMKKYLDEYIGKGQRKDLHKYSDKIEEKFENGPFLNGLVRFAQNKFSDDIEFEQRLDRNPYLIGDQNGVYDLKNGIHRLGLPEDYVSMKMGASYRDFTWDHPEVKSVMRYWAKMHVDPVLRHWVLKAFSVCMVAGNIEKMILILTNDDGNAGKSKELEFLEEIFGEYADTLKRDRFVVSTVKSAGGPEPDVANMVGKRLASVKEISKNETLDIGALKVNSGGDKRQVRSLHQEGGAVKMLYTMLIMLNKLPAFPADDQPTLNRLRIIPHESIFDSNAPDDPKEQWIRKHFKPDKNIDAKLTKLRDAGYWVLLQYFKFYQAEGLDQVPSKVMEATNQYKLNNDIFSQFIKSRFVEDIKDKKAYVKIDPKLYQDYVTHFSQSTKGTSLKPCKLHEFKLDMITYFDHIKTEIRKTPSGKPVYFKYVDTSKKCTIIRGCRLRTDEDSEIEDEAIEEKLEGEGSEEDEWEPDIIEEDTNNLDDFNKYFTGPTFIGVEDDENSILFSD